jgi:O-antigen/teichoic acid export membrane protein
MSTGPSDPPADLLDTPAAGPTAIRGGALRGAGYALALFLSLVSVPLLVRHLGVVDFGHYVLVTALLTLVAGVTEGGLQAVGTREYTVRIGSERDRLMRNLLGVRLALTTAGVAVAVAFAVVAGYDRILVLGTAIAGLGLLVQSIQTLLAVPLSAQLRLGWVTLADLLRQAVLVALTVALVVAGAELLPFFVVSVPAALCAAVLTARLVRGMTSFRPAFDRAEWWLLIRDTVPYAAAIAVNVAYFRLAVVLMSLLATELQTGYFAASFRILEVLLPVPSVVVGAVFPILARAARDDPRRLGYATQRIFEVALIGGVGLVLVIELAAPTIVHVLAGDASEPSIEVLRLQAPALAATFLAVAGGFPLLSLRRHRALLAANLAALAASISLCLALIPPLDARGAAIATTVAEVALAAVTLILLARASQGWRLSTAALGPVAIAAGVGALAVLAPVPDVVRALVGGGAYLGVLVLLGRIPVELRDAFVRRGQ